MPDIQAVGIRSPAFVVAMM